MNLLLDTCVFLWMVNEPSRLSAEARAAVVDPANDIHLSVVSVWEIVTKVALKRLFLADRPERLIPRQRALHRVLTLPLDEAATLHLERLPRVHRDPFDRMLVCQAISAGMPIVTPDEAIRSYPVRTIW